MFPVRRERAPFLPPARRPLWQARTFLQRRSLHRAAERTSALRLQNTQREDRVTLCRRRAGRTSSGRRFAARISPGLPQRKGQQQATPATTIKAPLNPSGTGHAWPMSGPTVGPFACGQPRLGLTTPLGVFIHLISVNCYAVPKVIYDGEKEAHNVDLQEAPFNCYYYERPHK
ncbi:hypothetical protein NDU88_005711 [Pleurodeles waltl]|uniref:Uncharacterized protein n=1 Tax=Pleurodeles waltl TaxID=8319 RepID=A0AAV7VKR5_PLEWA|nr:hypothetical protein NDU88_005711 [Pleurodeles waltl]